MTRHTLQAIVIVMAILVVGAKLAAADAAKLTAAGLQQ
jgi:hypothetical protein